MINQQHTIFKSRLGIILTKAAYISESQLNKALTYQQKRKIKLGTALLELNLISHNQLKFALKRQSWTRAVAATIAIACAPFNSAFASEKPESNSIAAQNRPIERLTNNQYSYDIDYSTVYFNHGSENFYYSDKNNRHFIVNKNISEQSGMKFSIFSEHPSNQSTSVTYDLSPQISLFNTSYKPTKNRYVSKGASRQGLDHYTNTKPVVFMLTIKGRCILQNSDNITRMWSLDKAHHGIQRKAQLMFSITKQF